MIRSPGGGEHRALARIMRGADERRVVVPRIPTQGGPVDDRISEPEEFDEE